MYNGSLFLIYAERDNSNINVYCNEGISVSLLYYFVCQRPCTYHMIIVHTIALCECVCVYMCANCRFSVWCAGAWSWFSCLLSPCLHKACSTHAQLIQYTSLYNA